MAEGAPQRDTMMKPKFQASQRASKQAMNKVFISILNGMISICPLEASPNQIVLVVLVASFHAYIIFLFIVSHEENILADFYMCYNHIL